MKPIALVALFIGAAIGLYFPDIDRVFPFLLHRSGITHSVLIPFAVLWLTREQRSEWLRAGLIGVCLTLAVHLSFDLFPVLWMGYGLISLPVIGQLNGTLSMLWVAANMVGCVYLALFLMNTRSELTVAAVISAAAFMLASQTERVFWSALIVLLAAWFAASCLPNNVVRGQAIARTVRQWRVAQRP